MKAVAVFLLLLFCGLVCGNGRGMRSSHRPYYPSYSWNCREGPRLYGATQVDAGMGKVVVADRYNRTFFLSGAAWYRLGRQAIKHVTAGAGGIWGTCYKNQVYKYIAGNFMLAKGAKLQQVDSGGDGQIVGAGLNGYSTSCLRESSALGFCGTRRPWWSSVSKAFKYFSCGPKLGCWGVGKDFQIWVTQSMTASTCATGRWIRVSGSKMKMIEVSTDGRVFGVNTKGKVYERMGISSTLRQGRFWRLIPVCLGVKHASFDLKHLWVVTNSGLIMKCTH